MIERTDIPSAVTALQRAVADPGVSAWVAANAGSGKTHVLAQRVINLLLDGVAPEKILCITFTKAAAANMAKRVFDTLADWTRLDDAELDDAIRDSAAMAPDSRRRALARQLFARALETPGGLKVQTIHAFCTQLLHRFPFEADVAARFTVLDDVEQSELQEGLIFDVLLEGSRNPATPLGRALESAMAAASDQTFSEVIREAIGRRDAFIRWVIEAGGIDNAIAALARTLGIAPDDSIAAINEKILRDPLIAPSEWAAIAEVLAAGRATDQERAEAFRALAREPAAASLDAYLEVFCTQEGALRKNVVTQAIDPALRARLAAEQDRIRALLERRRAVACRDRSAALLVVTHQVLERFAREKARRGLLDYDDLIDKSLALLKSTDAAWVHYKLDLGIDHLLIDEAQDTSKKQWEIVRLLTDEFTAGLGARDTRRTIFAVGDEKQSIYSFQNAAPREFHEMRRHFEQRHRDSERPFVAKQFTYSFRSGETVLAAVDAVFKEATVARSISSDEAGVPPHFALPGAAPSRVEIWEPTEPDARPALEGWDAPFDTVSETSPRVKLARRIARRVRRLIEEREPVGRKRRPARYGDVLVLVRQRGELFGAIIRALKNEGVDVAGADRLVLTEHIAVMDLLALADALLLPQDDLALATVLRSPLFGFSDDDLFKVAFGRGRLSLRTALQKKAAEGEPFATASALLDVWTQQASSHSPFSFYARLLGAHGSRRRFIGRLGPEANDALDEFLNLALEYERRETPSLQGFVSWLRTAAIEIKRDLEIERDEVRVMTVHGAKGLEAPIVILADTTTAPTGPKPPRLLPLPGGAVAWAGRKRDDIDLITDARTAAASDATDEYRRLLYVAMTRAADRLIVCAALGKVKLPDGCWYNLIDGTLKPQSVEEQDGEEKIFRFRKPDDTAGTEPPMPADDEMPAKPPAPPPVWLRKNAPPEPSRPARITPSAAFAARPERTDFAVAAGERQKALARGRAAHRLLQSLPDLRPAARADAAARYLSSAADELDATERQAIATRVLSIIDDPQFAAVFAPGGRAEVPLVGALTLDGERKAVSGQIDRLCVTGDEVLIVDFKTDRDVPAGPDDVADPYVGQLALYRALLSSLYPDRTVRAALVFVAGPALIEIPEKRLESVLKGAFPKP
jgi:ATP-dependent helicase/nuclease subunit A